LKDLIGRISIHLEKNVKGLKAKELAVLCGVSRKEVNRVLYGEEHIFVSDGAKVPTWSLFTPSESQKPRKPIVDRIKLDPRASGTYEIEVYGQVLVVDFVLQEKSRNDALYKIEIKEPNHILISVTRIFEDENLEESDHHLEKWQVLVLAFAVVEHLTNTAFSIGQKQLQPDITNVTRKLLAARAQHSL
jgi:hypothetical protein